MSKTNAKAPRLAAPKKPSGEEVKTQQARFIMQQRGAMAQSAMNSLLANPSLDMKETTPGDIAAYAFDCADAFVEKMYGFILNEPKEEEA